MFTEIDQHVSGHEAPSSGFSQPSPFWIDSHSASLLDDKRNPIKCQPISGISGTIKT